MSFLEVINIHKEYEGKPLLCGVNFAVERGEIVSLLGPSGSGKTTLLRIIAGLEEMRAGSVELDGKDLNGTPPHRRGIVLMFQEYALFPHRTVAENVAFGLKYRTAHTGQENADRVGEMLALVGLEEFADRDVNELSGGERQRVALARSLAPEPRLLLLDEPLGSLDRNLRERLMEELPAILNEVGVTAISVTHDQEEAFAVADRVVLLHEGRVVQAGAPADVYDAPASRWVARFLGLRNLLSATVISASPPRLETALGPLTLPETQRPPEQGTEGTLLIHPWGISTTSPEDAELRGTVIKRSFHGRYYRLVVAINGVELHFAREPGQHVPDRNATTGLRLKPSALRWL
jgi:ABC-type Fe3+/spermidine/putrescine transport system ATPase subunit